MELIGWQSACSSSAVVLDDVVFIFRRPTNFVSIGTSYIFFYVGGRFLQFNQSFNTSSPSSNSRSSSDLRKTVLMSVVARSIDIWIFLNVGRLTIEGQLVFGAILTNRLMHWRSTVYGLGLTFTGYRLIYKRRSGAEPFSSINWSNAHEVTGEYSAIANLSI